MGFGAHTHSFQDVNHALTGVAESVVNHLARGAFKRRGAELVAGDVNGGPGESFALNTHKGTWADFADASGEMSGDMIDYWAAVRGLKKGEAKREAEEWLFGQEPAPAPKADNYVPWKDGHMAGKWTYTTADGQPWVTMYRFNDPSKPGAKDFVPWDEERKRWVMPEGMRPLYNLPAVIEAVRTGKPVIVVEGEKKADRLNALGYVATASTNGARSAHKTDWAPLAGADIVVWPDNDAPGDRYAQVVAERLKDAKAGTVRRLTPPEGKSEGWDAADATDEEARGLIASASASAPVVGMPLLSATPFVLPDCATIPQRSWLYGHHLIRRFVSLTVAPGACGKSSLLIADALAMVTGRDLLGVPVYGGPLRVWLWNLEDPADELARRIVGTAQHYGITSEDIAGRLFVDSGRDQGLCLARQTRDGVEIIEPVADALVAELKARQIDVLIIDPFVSSHQVSENDNGAIDAVAKRWGTIADRAGCAIEIVHHLRKLQGLEATAESARGAVALVAAARSVRVLNRMTRDEAASAGLEAHHGYFRVYDDKNNLSPSADRADWFKLASVELSNGDNVGVVTLWAWPDPFADITVADLAAVQHAVSGKGYRASIQAREWVGYAVADVLGLDGQDKEARARIKGLLKTWIKNGALVEIKAQGADRHQRPVIEVGAWAENPPAPL